MGVEIAIAPIVILLVFAIGLFVWSVAVRRSTRGGTQRRRLAR